MSVDLKSVDGRAIRKLIPLSTLPGPQFNTLCADLEIIEQEKGYTLFKKGDTQKELVYLLNGEVSLEAEGLMVETVNSQDDHARFALAHQIPRKIDAVAVNKIRFLRIDPDLIKELFKTSTNKDNAMMDVDEVADESDDWMTRLLQTTIFRLIPAAHLQKILISLEEINVKEGDVIIQQDDYPPDYFYIIKQGVCSLTRKPSATAKEIKLAELKQGEAFGEGSILSDQPRDVTISAMTEMSLLRLDKQHFLQLIRDPIIKFVEYPAIPAERDNGAVVLDIRTVDEYKKDHIEGSSNLPFFALRLNLKSLDRRKKIILVCDDGKLSEAAAFILIKSKFDTYVMKGGMQKVYKKHRIAEESIPKDEPPLENPGTGDENYVESLSDSGFHDMESTAQILSEKERNANGISGLDSQLALLQKENEQLRKKIAQLQEQNIILKRDKEHIEKVYRTRLKSGKS
ncbi:MAG: cyclic nucleotide-binding domain-containing protein [Gammaproteobacteria bacterium]